MKVVKRIAKVALLTAVLGALGFGGFVYTQTSAYESSMNKVYDVQPMAITKSDDAAVIARGEHLSKSLAGCAAHDCHGADLGGGPAIAMGPLGTMVAPNATIAMAAYSDGELARLIRHGIKKDGRSVCFMPVTDFSWLPDSDVTALVSYLRTVQPVDRANAGTTQMKTLGKVLDRQDKIVADVARRIDHDHVEPVPPPSPTPAYGKFVARLCTGCHGAHLSGGPIPGAPPSMPIPLNLTPDATGLGGWSFDDFEHMIQTATRKNGKPLAPMMAVEILRNMDDTEKHALFAYLQSLPPLAFGSR